MENLRHSSLRMAFNYKFSKFGKVCSINDWHIQIQKILLKITSFSFSLYFYFIFYIMYIMV